MPNDAEVKDGQIVEGPDLDLDADDELLRESVRKPTTVRVNGVMISVPHMSDWDINASQLVNAGRWYDWAEMVMSPDDAKLFKGAGLKQYQIQAIIDAVTSRNGTSPGKSRRSGNSSGSTRKR